MPAKLYLPENEIVTTWISNSNATTRNMAAEYGCSSATIAAVLRKHLSADAIDIAKRHKISVSTAARPDLKTEDHRERARYASSCVTPEGRNAQREGALRGSEISANKLIKRVPSGRERLKTNSFV